MAQCINQRDHNKFQLQLSIVTIEWEKVRKDPTSYDFYLEELKTAYEENDNELSKEFFKEFEHPVHP